MAITQCSECGGNVSTMAEACPHCGTTDARDDALEWKHATPNRRLPELRELGWVDMKEAEPVTQRSNLWTQYTSLQGRISRKTFWLWFFVPIAVLSMLSTLLDLSLGTYVSGAGFGPAWLPGQASGPVSFTMTLLTLWPFTVGWVKRLHDRDKTGKYLAALYGSLITAVILVMVITVVETTSPGSGWASTFCMISRPVTCGRSNERIRTRQTANLCMVTIT